MKFLFLTLSSIWIISKPSEYWLGKNRAIQLHLVFENTTNIQGFKGISQSLSFLQSQPDSCLTSACHWTSIWDPDNHINVSTNPFKHRNSPKSSDFSYRFLSSIISEFLFNSSLTIKSISKSHFIAVILPSHLINTFTGLGLSAIWHVHEMGQQFWTNHITFKLLYWALVHNTIGMNW